MEFNFTENQTMVRDLARGILEKEVTSDRVKKVESDPDWFDRPLWATLAEAGLLGLVVPEDLGGMGFGILETCAFLGEIGRVVAPVPAFATLVLGALPVARFGTEAQKNELLTPLAAGKAILTAALVDAASAELDRPGTTARREGGAWVLDGCKVMVPAAGLAQRVLVPAATPEGVGIFLVDPHSEGVTLTRQRSSTGEPLFTAALAAARVGQEHLLGDDPRDGADKVRWMHDRALVAIAATQVGVSEKALEITSGYVREREQFGVPIGSFQAVQHRSADAYIDLQSMRWVIWRAAWKLSQGMDATRETMVAKFWAAEAGARIAASAQHLHGGIGVDMDYPIHRYFLWSKALEVSLGAATPQLVRLGRELARSVD